MLRDYAGILDQSPRGGFCSLWPRSWQYGVGSTLSILGHIHIIPGIGSQLRPDDFSRQILHQWGQVAIEVAGATLNLEIQNGGTFILDASFVASVVAFLLLHLTDFVVGVG